MRVTMGLIAALLALTGCSSPDNYVDVSADDMGADWPLTVDSGRLSCHGAGAVVFQPPQGGKYAVNGQAETISGVRDIEPLWAEGDTTPKRDLSPLIQRGLELCSDA